MLNSVVIDTETLNTKPNSVILSIGAYAFDVSDFKKTQENIITQVSSDQVSNNYSLFSFYELADTFDQLLRGRTVSEETLSWWRSQSAESRTVLYGDKMPLDVILQSLTDWLYAHNGSTIYFRGTDFDGSILEHAYEQAGLICPWHFNKKRDVRSYIDAKLDTNFGYIQNYQGCFQKIPHFSLHDAMSDAEQMSVSYSMCLNRTSLMEV